MQVRDCMLTLSIKNGIVTIKADGNGTMLEWAMLTGYMQLLIGLAAYKKGKDLGDIKLDMWDLYDNAMSDLERQIRGMEEK